MERRTKSELEIHQLPDGAGFAPARGFPLTIIQTQRPVEIGAPDGNRTHISRTYPGILTQLNYGLIRNPNKNIYSDRGRGLAPKATSGRSSAKADGQVT